jgi:DNA uptake protein ComE-like DNA-binding protein
MKKSLFAWSLHQQKGIFILLVFGLSVELFWSLDLMTQEQILLEVPERHTEVNSLRTSSPQIETRSQIKTPYKPKLQLPIPATHQSNLNTASASDLLPIHGIGPVLSKRIIKYRDAIGGYTHKHQLYKVYGLDSVVALRLFDYFYVPNQ